MASPVPYNYAKYMNNNKHLMKRVYFQGIRNV